MSDIVASLRHWNPVTFPLAAQAADEIERLRSRLAEAEALLRENAGIAPMPLGWFDRVRALLERQP